jgi:hypothetical protein
METGILMMSAILNLALVVILDRALVLHRRERKELIDRIQAGSLREYEALQQGPGRARVKDIDQLANETANDRGVTVASLKKPQGWRSW